MLSVAFMQRRSSKHLAGAAFRLAGAVGLALRLACAMPAPLLALAACSTPSVPLPPPSVDLAALTFSQKAPQQIVVIGTPATAHANATFYIFDRNLGDGVIATAAANGSFESPPLAFTVGGSAEIYFVEPGGLRSETTCVTIELAQPLFGATCP